MEPAGGLRPGQLEVALAGRHVIRTVMMRSTLHLVSTADFLRLRTALQPALDRALRAFYG
ncbi:MAG: winged helix DNA-binding domain-containing protein, partial [Chloroflexi bacterium]|nr:winged helix DNA-binding domain-containing protein [Chloroflexota bacterium]